MKSTREVLALLSSASQGVQITEDRVRHALRRGDLEPPSTFAGRLAWSWPDILALASALGVNAPHRADTKVRDETP